MKVLSKFIPSVAFRCKFATFSDFWKGRIVWNYQCIFLRKSQSLNVLKSFTFSTAFYGKFAILSKSSTWANLLIFSLKNNFFHKINLLFLKETEFCMFWEIELSQSNFEANLIPLELMKKKSWSFLENPIYYFFEKTLSWQLLRFFTISAAFYGKFSTFKF